MDRKWISPDEFVREVGYDFPVGGGGGSRLDEITIVDADTGAQAGFCSKKLIDEDQALVSAATAALGRKPASLVLKRVFMHQHANAQCACRFDVLGLEAAGTASNGRAPSVVRDSGLHNERYTDRDVVFYRDREDGYATPETYRARPIVTRITLYPDGSLVVTEQLDSRSVSAS